MDFKPITTTEMLGKKALNMLTIEEITSWAITELKNGKESNNLNILAGMTDFDDTSEIFKFFDKVLSDYNLLENDTEKCVLEYAVFLTNKLFNNQNNFREICEELYWLYYDNNEEGIYSIWYKIYITIQDIESGFQSELYPNANKNNLNEIIKDEAIIFLKNLPIKL